VLDLRETDDQAPDLLMSNQHLHQVWAVRCGEKTAEHPNWRAWRDKAVLVNLCERACETCGGAWPGVDTIAVDVQIGATGIRQALSALEDQGLIEILDYAKGGRGRATVFRVLGRQLELAPGPCEACRGRMKQASDMTREPVREEPQRSTRRRKERPPGQPEPIGRVMGSLFTGTAERQHASDGFARKPIATEAKTHRNFSSGPPSDRAAGASVATLSEEKRAGQPSVNQEPSQTPLADARQAEPAEPASFGTTQHTPAALAAREGFLADLERTHPVIGARYRALVAEPSAATAAPGETAQPSGHAGGSAVRPGVASAPQEGNRAPRRIRTPGAPRGPT
jgi:hypothetical protein